MQIHNILRQNYTSFSRPYQLKLPLEIGHAIPDNDRVRLLGQFVEELDLRDLYSTYSRVKENQVSPRQLLKKLYKIKDEEGVEFVYGSGKRKAQFQRHIEKLEEYIERLNEYSRKLEILGDRNSYSKTDPDATFMRMKEDAMLNGQLKPAYNLQLGVDSGYISWLTLSPRPTDTMMLIPFLEGMEASLRHKYPVVVADAGYESEENYSYLEDHKIKAVIKPANYEISKTRKYKRDISRKENMPYNPEGDFYTCMNGCKLENCGIKNRKTASGYIRSVACRHRQRHQRLPWGIHEPVLMGRIHQRLHSEFDVSI